MTGIELSYVLAPELLHQPADRADLGRRHEQMDVVVHEDVGVQGDLGGQQRFSRQKQVAPSIAVVQESRQAIVAALHDVLSDVRQIEPGLSGHSASLAADRPRPAPLIADSCVRNRLDLSP